MAYSRQNRFYRAAPKPKPNPDPDPFGIGHNRAETIDAGDPDILQTRLARDYAVMLERFTELELGGAKVPQEIESEAQARNILDWISAQCRVLISQAEKAHAVEKKPFLESGRTVDRFFNDRIKRLQAVIAPIETRMQRWLMQRRVEAQRREEAERRRVREERDRAEAEAARLAAEAKAREEEGNRQAAVELTQRAEDAEATAQKASARLAEPPEKVNLHGDYGGTAFTVEKWDFEVVDPAAVPLGFLTIDEEAVRQAISEGTRSIAGLRIFKTDQFRIRRC